MHVYTWKGMLHCAMCIVQCAPVCPNMHKSGRECHFVPRATACIRASGRGCYFCTTCYSIIELVAACGVTCYSKIELIAACGCDVTCFSTFTVSVRTAGHAWTRVCYVQIYAGEQVRGLYLSSSIMNYRCRKLLSTFQKIRQHSLPALFHSFLSNNNKQSGGKCKCV